MGLAIRSPRRGGTLRCAHRAIQPTVIRSQRVPRLKLAPGEAIVYPPLAILQTIAAAASSYAWLGESAAAWVQTFERFLQDSPTVLGNAALSVKLSAVPAAATIRMTNSLGGGVRSKRALVYAYHTDRVAQDCSDAGVSLTAEEVVRVVPENLGTSEYACALESIKAFRREVVALELMTEPGQSSSGVEGFLTAPVVYSLLKRSWLLDEGLQEVAEGKIRLVATNAEETVWSSASQPITFAQPGDAGTDGRCVALGPANAVSEAALAAGRRPVLVPDAAGAVDLFGWGETNVNISESYGSTIFRSFDSFLVPPALWAPDAGEPDQNVMAALYCSGLGRYCLEVDDLHPEDEQYVDEYGYSLYNECPADTSLRVIGDCDVPCTDYTCRADRYLALMLSADGTQTLPAVTLRAVDEDGEGVSGLRVRLRQIYQIYPDLPKLGAIISCGLASSALGEEVDSGSGFNSAYQSTFLDGTDKADWAEACITDAGGYVTMNVNYLPGTNPLVTLIEGLPEGYKIPRPPEYVKAAATGTMLAEYQAFRLLADGSLVPTCKSSPFRLDVEAPGATLQWQQHPNAIANEDDNWKSRTFRAIAEVEPVTDFAFAVPLYSGEALVHPVARLDYTIFSGLDLFALTSDDIGGEPVQLWFTLRGENGAGVPNKLASVEFVQLPQYMTGFSTRLRGCMTTQYYKDAGFELGTCSELFGRQTITDYGLDAQQYANEGTPFQTYPYAPYATVISTSTNASGIGYVDVAFHKGYPGLYALVVQVDGMRSAPVMLPVPSTLASIVITQEPSRRTPVMNATIAPGAELPEGGWLWPVGVALPHPLIVNLLDSAGQPELGYAASVRAVDANTGEPLPDDRVLFDLYTDTRTPYTGSARSTPADENGRSVFNDLSLVDAVDGQCFVLQAYFKAMSTPAEAFLRSTASLESLLDTEVTATSTVKFCAVNKRTLTIASQPSASTALGEPFGEPPIVRLESPLERVATAQGDYFALPRGLDGAQVIQVLPAVVGGTPIPGSLGKLFADAGLSQYRCITYSGDFISGACSNAADVLDDVYAAEVDPNRTFLSNGFVIGGYVVDDATLTASVGMGALYSALRPGVPPTYAVGFNFDGLSWDRSFSSNVAMRLGAVTEISLGTTEASLTGDIVLDRTPATVQWTNIPPSSIVVNEPMVLTGKVLIASGAPLPGVSIAVSVAPPTGATTSPISYLENIFGSQTIPVSSAPPTLNQSTVTAISDEYGNVRFLTRFVEAPRTGRVSLLLTSLGSNPVKSKRSVPITVSNRVQAVAATNFSLSLTGADGIGSPFTFEVRVRGEKPVSFPTVVALPGYTDVAVKIGEGQGTALSVAELSTRSLDWMREQISFRVFSEQDLESIRQSGELQRASAQFALDKLGDAANWTSELVSDAGEVNVSEPVSAAQSLKLQLQAFSAAVAKKAASVTPDGLIEFAKLATGGTAPSESTPGGPSSNAASVLAVNPTQVIITSYNASNGIAIVRVSGVSLKVRKPGRFYLQPVVAGISGPLGGDIVIAKYNTKSATAVASQYAFRIGTTAIICAMAVGNSDFHVPYLAVPFSLTVIFVFGALTINTYRDTLGDPYGVGLWWMICFCGILVFTLLGLAGQYITERKGKLVYCCTPFPYRRRVWYYSYVSWLVNQQPKSLPAQLRRQIRQGEADGSMVLADRLLLEGRIANLRRDELSLSVQFKALVRGIFADDLATAFYVPARIAVAFVISLFSTVFMSIWFARTFSNLRTTVQTLDVRTLSAILGSIATLQSQFELLTGSDLPLEAIRWLQWNADKVHGYMVSLADALFAASIIGSTLGLLAFTAAYVVLVCDFRSAILKARRGEFDFRRDKVAIKLAMTYVGTSVSNSLLTYLLVSFILSVVVVLVAWSLSRDVLGWIIVQNKALIIALAIITVVNIVIKKVVTTYVGPKDVIKKRYAWMAYEMYEMLLQMATGVVKSLVRFVIVVVIALISLPRVDHSPFPAWVEAYLLLDSGSKSYQGVVLLYHIHNNPCVHVFIWLLQEGGEARQKGILPPRTAMHNKWRKALFLVRNPKVRMTAPEGQRGHVASTDEPL